MKIKIENISFHYPSEPEPVLKNINLEFASGEAVAIIGQNGAGKTTLVKLINGLLKPSLGRIMIGDMDTSHFTTAKIARKVGYVFQNPDDQIFNSDVISEVEYSLKYFGWSKDKIRETLRQAIDITGIKDFLGEHPMNLPYSVRKFVTITSVLAVDTDVVIFDEPTAGQDAKGIRQLELIIDYLKKRNKIVIIITHDMDFAVHNFKRIIAMAHGSVLADGSGSEIFNNDELLQEAKLNKPYIMQLKERMEMQGDILTRGDFVKEFMRQYND